MAGYFQGNVYKIPQCEYYSLSVLFFQVKEEASLMAQQVKNHLQCRRHRRWGFDPWVWKIPWRRKWQSTPVFLPGKSRGQRSLVGYSPRGRKGADTTEHTNTWEKSCLIHNSRQLQSALAWDSHYALMCSSSVLPTQSISKAYFEGSRCRHIYCFFKGILG